MRTRQALASEKLGSDPTYQGGPAANLSTELVWLEATYICSRKDQDCCRVWDGDSRAAGGPNAPLYVLCVGVMGMVVFERANFLRLQ